MVNYLEHSRPGLFTKLELLDLMAVNCVCPIVLYELIRWIG